MKQFKRILAIVLTVAMVASMAVVFSATATATENVTKWVNNGGEVVTPSTASFSKIDPAFSFGTYLRGDGTTAGTSWDATRDDYETAEDFGWKLNDGNCAGRVIKGYRYICWPQYNLGVKFSAPYTGTIKVTYQLGNDSEWPGMEKCSLIVGTDNLYIDKDGNTYNQLKEKDVTVADFTQQETMELDVTAGQNLYFIIRNLQNYRTANFWINSVEYTSVKFVGTATMIGHSISAMDTPVVNFYVKLDGSPMGVAANITVGTDAPISVVGEAYTGVGPDGENFTAEDYVYVYSVPVSAKRMTETITISLVKDGEEMLKDNNTYSVAQYCYAQVSAYNAAGAEATEAQLSVAKACTGILIYGKTMQKYFGYNTENLPMIDAGLLALVTADMQ